MTSEKFIEFWNVWSENWYTLTFFDGQIERKIGSICTIKMGAAEQIHKTYEAIKCIVKDSYFKETQKKLSRYKRASVLTYAIIKSKPLNYNYNMKKKYDIYYLKQRLAFFMAIGSILQDYKEEDIASIEQPIFYFKELGITELYEGDDDFLMSVYKDLFFSEIYHNFNVLSMANLYGLLVERASKLPLFTPIDNEKSIATQ